MGFYKYSGAKGKEKGNGIVEAKNQREAITKVRSMGYKNIKLQVSKSGPDGKLRPLSLNEKIDFTQTFQILNQAGVPIIEALVFIGNDAASPRTRSMAHAIRQDILEGGTFSNSVAKYPQIFDKIFTGLVKAGEDSGELDKTLGRLAELLKKQSAIKGKVVGAMLYPVFVIVLALVIVIIMVVFVFPKFAETFAQTGRALPPITQACISLGTSIIKYWWAYIAGSVGFVWFCIKSFEWPRTRAFIDRWSLKVPVFNNLVLKSNFSNFLTVLLVAYNAGIPIVDCIYLSNMTLTNGVLRDALAKANQKVQQGAQLSLALKASSVVPKMVVFMISTGEQSGRLSDLLENAVYFIDQELDKAVDVVTKMMEPLLIVVIGFIVLFMALAFYLPLFGLSQGM